MIWVASNITQRSVELYAQLYYLFTLQIFFLAMNGICWSKWGKE